MPSMLHAVTDGTFDDEVLRSELPVLLEFTAPWCRPCRTIEPILEELAVEHEGRLRLVALDVDDNLGVPSRYGVLTVPTVMLFVGGEPQVTLLGANPKRRYAEAIAPHLA
jgi:thioredoxin 1